MSQETPASTTEAQIKNKRRISPFWLLPFIALMIASWLIWDSYQDRGNTVTIDFMSADGIVPGRTPVRYQGVEVGTVQDISLSDDLRKIEVKVSIKSDMKDALREETQFWLVTPKASLAGVSGLDALVGGNYIGMMPGKGKEQDHFVALDTQPKYRLDNGDLMIHLQAPDLGSLNSGSLVYFRKIPVGKVYDYAINPNKQGVVIDVLIERRFTDLVKKGSRFWNVSGVDANVSISGAKVKLESLAALVNGAIAFDSPEESKPAEAEDTFGLYEDLAHSQRGVIIKLELPSGAGLTADSTPLMYQGLEVGQLTKLDLNPGGKVTGEMTVDPSVVTLLRENTRIELRNPKLSLSDANLSALLTGKTFELVPGDGEPRKEFVVVPGEKALLHEPDCHGFTGSRGGDGHFGPLAARLAHAGIASIAMDFPGCGESEEPFTAYTLSNIRADMTAAIAYMGMTYGADTTRLGLVGHSMGGRAVSLYLDGRDYPVTAAALWSPADNTGLDGLEFLAHDADERAALRQTADENGSVELPQWGVAAGAALFDEMAASDPCGVLAPAH